MLHHDADSAASAGLHVFVHRKPRSRGTGNRWCPTNRPRRQSAMAQPKLLGVAQRLLLAVGTECGASTSTLGSSALQQLKHAAGQPCTASLLPSHHRHACMRLMSGEAASSSGSNSGAAQGTFKTSRLTGSMSSARPGSGPAPPSDNVSQGAKIAGSLPKGFFASQQAAFNAIPPLPKFLGFAGAIPFLLLHPALATYLDFEDFAHWVATGQVAYGALIVSFLGAVHWGIALTSTLTGATARAVQRERYIWSVFPSLAAWPALMMEPGPGSFCIALLLAICYMSDRSHAKLGSLPAWYMTLRGYLSTIAGLSMLSTAAWFLSKDIEKMKKRMEEDDRRRAARFSQASAPMAQPSPAAAAALPASQAASDAAPAKKKGWW